MRPYVFDVNYVVRNIDPVVEPIVIVDVELDEACVATAQ
jgi:hypothetical protein